MKKLVIGIAIVFMMSSFAMASSRENCGCGLGSMVLEDANTDSLLMQMVVTILNGICGNQTFGITSGTLGCEKPSKIVKNEIMDKYVADNMDNLAVDIASGGGESLDALSEIAGIDDGKREVFQLTLQNNFDVIFMSENTTHKTVVDQINTIIENI